ncbi:unnamed protein product [Clonostachys byssicola]|uniref:Uncharacterized protein n=1 Tax=Clonostachys byssicola TaxID=160290 RepID=A0A9N9YBS2_9HYPO|nr:unnamed protein product [Clonostachys byssicola]
MVFQAVNLANITKVLLFLVSQVIEAMMLDIMPLFGILVASATFKFWGKAYWNLWDVLSAALDYYEMSPTSRGLVFLASFAFVVAVLGTNVAANLFLSAVTLPAFSPGGSTFDGDKFYAPC